MMHFRHFILMGVFLGAVAFLPNDAFAEKNGAAVQSDPQNAVVQPDSQNAAVQPGPQNTEIHTLVSEKSNNPTASEKAVPVPSENATKSNGGKIHKPVTNPGNGQTVPTEHVPEAPNQTKSGIEKIVPPIEPTGKPAGSAAQVQGAGQTGPEKPNVVTNKLRKVSEPTSAKPTESREETGSNLPGVHAKSDPFAKDTDSQVSIRTGRTLTLVPESPIDKANQPPSDSSNVPWDIGIMNTPPQRTQSSGGQPNDQFNPGGGTINFIANWFNWNEYYVSNLAQIYFSSQDRFCHQWINAPPAPPPKAAPFLNVYC